MSLVIGTNTMALTAQDSLRANQLKTDTHMQRLSNGLRINSASDDAAGLAISQRMTSRIKGLNQAVRNINDAVNLLQTAEGGLNSITEMLQRIRELSVLSVNDTNSNNERAYLQMEAFALQEQIKKTIDSTSWNGKKLLDRSFSDQKIQTGEASDSNFPISIPSFVLGIPTPTYTSYGQFVVQFAYSGVTPVMYNARLNSDTGELMTSIDSNWATAEDKTSDTTIRLSDFIYGGNGGPTGQGHISIAPGSVIPNEAINVDYTGDVYPWNAIYINYQYKDGVYTIKNVGSNSSGVTSITATFNSGSTIASDPNYVGFTQIDISDAISASTAISAIDDAIKTIDDTRSKVGSYMNRLSHAADNATDMATKLAASLSRIQDTNYAEETAMFARTQIIQQAAAAMLVQANQHQRTVLPLLRNL